MTFANFLCFEGNKQIVIAIQARTYNYCFEYMRILHMQRLKLINIYGIIMTFESKFASPLEPPAWGAITFGHIVLIGGH
jgi:hypothetical protein